MKKSYPAEGVRRRLEVSSKADMRDAFSIDVDRILSSEEMSQIAGNLEAAAREPALSRG